MGGKQPKAGSPAGARECTAWAATSVGFKPWSHSDELRLAWAERTGLKGEQGAGRVSRTGTGVYCTGVW